AGGTRAGAARRPRAQARRCAQETGGPAGLGARTGARGGEVHRRVRARKSVAVDRDRRRSGRAGRHRDRRAARGSALAAHFPFCFTATVAWAGPRRTVIVYWPLLPLATNCNE